MSTPTQQDLSTEQPETALNVNRDRLRIFNYIDTHRARRNESGRDVLTPANGSEGYGSMLGGKVRELWKAGMAVLGSDGYYVLTEAGRRRRDQAKDEYAAASITAGK